MKNSNDDLYSTITSSQQNDITYSLPSIRTKKMGKIEKLGYLVKD